MHGDAASVAPREDAATPSRPPGLWLRLLRLGGVGIYVDPLVVLLLAWVLARRPGSEGSLTWGAPLGIVLGSVLLHELGHALAARRRGLRVGGIFLHLVPFAYVERGAPADAWRVALAGPASNLAAAGVLLLAFGARGLPWSNPERWLEDPRWLAIGLNALMGLANLVPALPADGGRALRAALMLRMPPATACAYAARVGTFVGAALALAGILLWSWPDSLALGLLGVFFCVVAWREARAGRSRRRARRRRAGSGA